MNTQKGVTSVVWVIIIAVVLGGGYLVGFQKYKIFPTRFEFIDECEQATGKACEFICEEISRWSNGVVGTACATNGWTPTQKPSLAKQIEKDVVDWDIYRNEDYGFEFKYPGEIFALTEANMYGMKSVKLISVNKLQFLGEKRCHYGESDFTSICSAESEGGISFTFVSKPIKNVADASAERIIIANKEGLFSGIGAEGEGINTYYIPLNPSQTLIVRDLYRLVDGGTATFPSTMETRQIFSTLKFTK